MPRHDLSLETEADQVGSSLAGSDEPVNISHLGLAFHSIRTIHEYETVCP